HLVRAAARFFQRRVIEGVSEARAGARRGGLGRGRVGAHGGRLHTPKSPTPRHGGFRRGVDGLVSSRGVSRRRGDRRGRRRIGRAPACSPGPGAATTNATGKKR